MDQNFEKMIKYDVYSNIVEVNNWSFVQILLLFEIKMSYCGKI